MAAVQALASGAIDAIAAATSGDGRDVLIQNLGPNYVHFEIGAVATVAGSARIDPLGGTASFRLNPGHRVSIITVTADQVTPADTRIEIG